MKHQHFADDQPAPGLAEFKALPEAALHRDRRHLESRHGDALARNGFELQYLDFADLGRMLGVGAHISALRRTRVGPFEVTRAISLDEAVRRLETRDDLDTLVQQFRLRTETTNVPVPVPASEPAAELVAV